jgi:multiple sugar transport system ATP-binding protein
MARVTIENVSKVFKGSRAEVCAARNISLEVEDHEFLVLVGPSGSGKTTLLRLISGLDEPSSGTISIGSRVVNGIDPKDREVAMVFQRFALYPHLTVSENIGLGLKLRKVPKAEAERRVRTAAEILGLASLLDRKPESLSGGEQQRVAVGRAMVLQPKVFLFDEPLSNLDARMRLQMRAEIARLHQHLGATMIYVTHDQEEAMTLGDRIAVLKDGVVQQTATPLTLYRQPANMFVAGFIGSPPMNFIPGILRQVAGSLHFEGQGLSGTGSIRMPISESHRPQLSARAGQPAIIGIRPEHVTVKRIAESPVDRGVPAVVERAVPTGPDTWLSLTAGVHTIVARAPSGCGVAANEKVSLLFDAAMTHYFDPVTGVALV